MALGNARIKNVFGPLSAKACPAPGSRCRELQLTISLIFLIDEGVAGLVDSWRIGTATLRKILHDWLQALRCQPVERHVLARFARAA
jgi:hypothetical protein